MDTLFLQIWEFHKHFKVPVKDVYDMWPAPVLTVALTAEKAAFGRVYRKPLVQTLQSHG